VLGGCAPQRRVAAPVVPRQQAIIPPPAAAEPSLPPIGAVPAPDGKKRIALLLPLSGPSAGIGRAMLDAAHMALADIADDGVELLPRDTGGTADGAARAAQDVLTQGVVMVLGPLLQAEVEAVKPLARQAGVALVAFSTQAALAGDGTFLLSFLPQQEVRRVTAFASEKGAQRFAALAPETPLGRLAVDELRAAAAETGGSVARVEFYDPQANDLTPVVRRLASFDARKGALEAQRRQLAAANDEASRQALRRLQGRETAGDPEFDAVLIPEVGARLKAVASLLPYYEVDPAKVRLLGIGIWDEPGLGQEPALVGAWYAAPPPDARGDFEKRYKELYKRDPPRLATLGYDAAALASLLGRADGPNDFSAATLTNPSGFAGMGGIFRFLPNGLVQRGLAVLEVKRQGVEVVGPPPESFQDLAY
jgi:ABC-type branched-subunit amino acid transport system substrate-binding protein